MKIEGGKFIFTEEELKELLDKVSFEGYKEGIIDAGKQYKLVTRGLEMEAEQTGWNQPDGTDVFSPAS